jgi:DNA mismatch endonuclease (patch repair protein)
VVLPKLRIAIFLDGCFWHRCPRCYRAPGSNQQYWETKIARNQARDKQVNLELRARGWQPLRIWECRIRREKQLEPFLLRRLSASKLPTGTDILAK